MELLQAYRTEYVRAAPPQMIDEPRIRGPWVTAMTVEVVRIFTPSEEQRRDGGDSDDSSRVDQIDGGGMSDGVEDSMYVLLRAPRDPPSCEKQRGPGGELNRGQHGRQKTKFDERESLRNPDQ